jgi:hypothetical protein
MALRIKDLGLVQAMRGVAESVYSSKLYLIDRIDVIESDFTAEDAQYELIQTLPAFGVRQLSAEEARREFGAIDAAFIRVTVATPRFDIPTGQYAVIDYSNSTAIYTGQVERVQPKLSSLVYVYINTAVAVEFDPLDVGIIL